MPAFRLAAEQKADMIELDVTLSRDKIPVVFHDKKLERTTSGRGKVRHFYLRELLELDAGSWFAPEFNGIRIPELEDVLKWAKDTIVLNIEIKKEAVDPDAAVGVENIVVDLIKEYAMEHQVVISSFSKRAIQKINVTDPNIHKNLLLNQYSSGRASDLKKVWTTGAEGLNLHPRQMRKPLMNLLIHHKIPAWVYTVDEAALMKKVIEKGATGIFTNRPDILHKVISEWGD